MSALNYTFSDSNMARQEWRWLIGLYVSEEGTFALSAIQEFVDPEDAADAMLVEPVTGLRGGGEIYERFVEMLDQAGIGRDSVRYDAIAKGIRRIDAAAARQFEASADLDEAEQISTQANFQAHLRAVKLAPFRAAIDAYCSTLSDERSRVGGGISRPSERARVQAFTEEYALQHRALPTERHSWRLRNGFLSGEHDFGERPGWWRSAADPLPGRA